MTGQSGNNNSRMSAGDKETGQKGGKEGDGNKPENTAGRLGEVAALNAAGIAASHTVKMSMLLKLKIKLQMLVQHAVMHTSVSIVLSICILIGTTIVALIDNAVINGSAVKDSNFVECTAYIDRAMIGKGGYETAVDVNKIKRQTAKRIYSVHYHYGLRPEQILSLIHI